MDDKKIESLINNEEQIELDEGMALVAMDKDNPGWQIVKRWLEQMAYHSWVDPRDVTDKKEWEWRELNAFHAANVAKELLESVAKATSRADYLDKVKNGEIDRKRMKIG